MLRQDRYITFSPEEVHFKDIAPYQLYVEKLTVTNITEMTFDINVRVSSSDRYEIFPSRFRLAPKEERTLELHLKLVRAPKKADFSDYLMLRSDHFDYRIPLECTIQEQHIDNSRSPVSRGKYTPTGSGKKSLNDGEYWRRKNEQTEEENYILAQKIKEFEGTVGQLTEQLEQAGSRFREELREKNQMIDKLSSELRREKLRVQELEGQINEREFAENYFARMKELLRQQSHDLDAVVDMALRQERLEAERKNQKILMMFEEKDHTIAELEKTLRDLDVDQSKLKAKVEEQRRLISDYESKAQRSQRDNQDLKEQIKLIETRVSQLTAENERSASQLRGRLEDMGRQHGDISRVKEENAALKRQNDSLKSEISKLKADNTVLAQKVNELVAREEYNREFYNRQKEDKIEVENLIIQKDKLISALQDKLFHQTAVLDQMLTQFNAGENVKKSEIQQLLNQSQEALKQLTVENEQLKNELVQMKEQHQQHHRSPRDFLVQSGSMRTEDLRTPGSPERTIDYKKKIVELEHQITELTQTNQDLQKSLDSEQRKRNELLNSQKELQDKILELQTSRDDMRRFEFESDIKLNQQKERRIYELESSLKMDREAQEALRRRCQELEQQLEFVQQENRRFQEEIEILAKRVETQHKDGIEEQALNHELIPKLNARISNLKYREQKLLEENAKLEEMYNSLKKEHAEMQQILQDIQRDENRQRDYGQASKQDDRQKSFSRSEATLGASRKDPFAESEGLLSSAGGDLRREVQILRTVKANLENEVMLALNKEKFLQENIEMLTAEKNELKEKNFKLKEEAQELEEKARQLEQKLKEQEFNYKRKVLDLQSELNTALDKIDRYESEIEQKELLDERLKIAEKIKTKVETEMVNSKAAYEQKINELSDQLNTMRTLNQEFKQKINEMEGEVYYAGSTLTEKDSNIERLAKEKDRLEKENEELSKLNRDVMQQVKALREEFNLLQQKTASEVAHKDRVESELRERARLLQEELDRVHQDKAKSRSEFSVELERLTRMHQETINMLREENRELERKYFAEIQDRKAETDSWAQREKYLGDQIHDLKEELIKTTDTQRRSSRGAIPQSSQKEVDRSATKKRGFKPRATLSPRVERSDDEHQLSESRLKLYEIDLRQKDGQIAELKAKLDSMQNRLVQCEREIDHLGSDRDRLLREKDQAESIISTQRKEIEALEAKSKYTSRTDEKIVSELTELKDYVYSLKRERDRISREMKANEQEYISSQQEIEHLLKLIRELEDKQVYSESEAARKLQEVKDQLIDASTQNQMLTVENKEIKVGLDAAEKQIMLLEREIKELRTKLSLELEIKEGLSDRVSGLEDALAKEADKYEKIIIDYRNELEKANATISLQREEMIEQSKTFEETTSKVLSKPNHLKRLPKIDIYERQLQLMKDKFLADVKDISLKFSGYVVQSENVKKGLSPKKEKKSIDKLFESYTNTITVNTQKDAQIMTLKEKLSKGKAEIENLKAQLKKSQEAATKLNDELNVLNQKRARMTPSLKGSALKPSQSVQNTGLGAADKSMSIVWNKENAEANDSQKSLKDIAALEAKLISIKGENKKLLEELKQVHQINMDLARGLDEAKVTEDRLQAEIVSLNKELNDVQKLHRKEIERMLADFDSVKIKWYSPEAYQKVVDDLQESNNINKELKEELQRKKDYIQSLKQAKETKQHDGYSLKKEVDQLQEENEKLKRSLKESTRRENAMKEFKERYDALKASEKALQTEKSELTDKVKQLKAEITRKDQAIKDLREKVDILNQHGDIKKEESEELERTREQLRKLKTEVDRKDQHLKALKMKFDALMTEQEQIKAETSTSVHQSTVELEREAKRHEQTRVQLKKAEAHHQHLIFVMRRLFRDTLSIIQKLRSRLSKETTKPQMRQGIDPSKFSDSIDILNLSPEEIQMFVDPKSYSTGTQANLQETSYQHTRLIEKFEDELNNKDSPSPSTLYDMLNAVIEERLAVEKRLQQ